MLSLELTFKNRNNKKTKYNDFTIDIKGFTYHSCYFIFISGTHKNYIYVLDVITYFCYLN